MIEYRHVINQGILTNVSNSGANLDAKYGFQYLGTQTKYGSSNVIWQKIIK
jgi:hypothetical protein